MANVLSVMDKATDENIRNQIANLELVTIGNIMGTEGKKMYSSFASGINSIGGFFGFEDKLLDDTKPKEMDKEIEEYADTLKDFSRRRLDEMFREKLRGRLGTAIGASDEVLSLQLVEKAADHMDIHSVLTPAQKIDAVFQRYSERIEERMRKAYNEASPEKQQEMRRSIDRDLAAMTEEERRQVQEALQVNEVTADTVISVMKTTGVTGLLVTGGSMFGSYILLSVIIHGVFTTLLGITLPFAVYTGAASTLSIVTGPVGWAAFAALGVWQYLSGSSKVDGELYCQLIFLARYLNRRSFTPGDDELPSWIASAKPEDVEQREEADRVLREKQEQYDEVSKQADYYEKRYREAAQKARGYEEQLVSLERAAEEAERMVEQYKLDAATAKRECEDRQKELEALETKQWASESEKKKAFNALDAALKLSRMDLKKREELYQQAVETIESAPKREWEISQMLSDAQMELQQESAFTAGAKERQAKEKKERKAFFREQGRQLEDQLQEWLGRANNHVYEFEDKFLQMLSHYDSETQKAVMKVICEIDRAKNPATLKSGELEEGQLWLPVTGCGFHLVYGYDRRENHVTFIKITDSGLLNQLERERREKAELQKQLDELHSVYDQKIKELQDRPDCRIDTIQDAQIRTYFDKALTGAQNEIDIFSPWLGHCVVNDRFCAKLEKLLKKGVTVKIRYGIGEYREEDERAKTTRKLATMLKKKFESYPNFHMLYNNSHAKLLLCDDKFYIVTSFNFLSFAGDYEKDNTRGELGEYSEYTSNIRALREDFFGFTGITLP